MSAASALDAVIASWIIRRRGRLGAATVERRLSAAHLPARDSARRPGYHWGDRRAYRGNQAQRRPLAGSASRSPNDVNGTATLMRALGARRAGNDLPGARAEDVALATRSPPTLAVNTSSGHWCSASPPNRVQNSPKPAACDNVIDVGQIIGSNHDQGLYLAGLNCDLFCVSSGRAQVEVSEPAICSGGRVPGRSDAR
jgi:hypothetical protein